MARTMALCSLPRTNPGNRQSVQAGQRPVQASPELRALDNKLPYGNLPRLLDGLALHGSGDAPKAG